MKELPADSMAQHARMIAAFCDDILAGECREAPRMKAVLEISKQTREAALPNKRAATDQ